MIHALPNNLRLVDVPADHYEAWLSCMFGVLGYAPERDADFVDFWRGVLPPDRALAVSDESGYLATGSAIDRDLVLPGGATVGMAGVGGIGVYATAKRQGVMRAMMRRLHRRAVEEGRPIAGLYCSEWPIYGRFGYGPASWFETVTIETGAVGWRDAAPGRELRPRCIPAEQARELAQQLHPASATPGEVLAPACYWHRLSLADPSSCRLDRLLGLLPSGVTGARFCVAVADRGLVSYRIQSGWTAHGTPKSTLYITDLLATDPEAAAALWRHVLTVDLVTEVQAPAIAVDDPLKWWVADARRLQPRRRDGLWLRPFDVAKLFETRTWSGEGALTLRIHDREGYADGTFHLAVSDGRGACTRRTAEADLQMEVATLGAILLGGTSATSLARAGHIQTSHLHSAALWDTLATPARAPFCSAKF